jgi:hypothetical protein
VRQGSTITEFQLEVRFLFGVDSTTRGRPCCKTCTGWRFAPLCLAGELSEGTA